MNKSLLVALFLYTGSVLSQAIPPNTGVCQTAEEAELVRLVNEYRAANGKPPVVNNMWLSATGQWHAWDLTTNPNVVGGQCNIHSWSNLPPPGVFWQGVCYTADHAQAEQMWGKPGQISAGLYTGAGFELSTICGCTQTANNALLWWRGSPAHNDVILNQGPTWSGILFTGMGVGIKDGYAMLWFGNGSVSGPMPLCSTDLIFANGFE